MRRVVAALLLTLLLAASAQAVDVNGCSEPTLLDLGGQANVSIAFSGLAYEPPCIRVSPGTSVTFNGSFGTHPLIGGTWDGQNEVIDPNSPIQFTITGSSATFVLLNQGVFPYLCFAHYTMGMIGAVYVGQETILAAGFED
jgi:plastocyanin